MSKRRVEDFLHEELTYKIRGALFSVYNELGFGHKEIIYQRALALEFGRLGIVYLREPKLKVMYAEQSVGIYSPDFIVEEKIILELKSLSFFPLNVDKQLVNYLKATGYNLALVVNFGSKLDIRRRVWTKKSAQSNVESA